MAKTCRTTYTCSMCGSKVSFILTTATINSECWTQLFPRRFKRDRVVPRKFNFRIPLFFTCTQCGQALPLPTPFPNRTSKFHD